MSHRTILLVIAIAIVVAGVAITAGVLVLTRAQSPPTRDQGALYQAVACLHPGAGNACTPSSTLSTRPSQPVTIETDGRTVTWFTVDGQEWMTTVASSVQLVRSLQAADFTNFRIDAIAT